MQTECVLVIAMRIVRRDALTWQAACVLNLRVLALPTGVLDKCREVVESMILDVVDLYWT